MAMNIIVYKIPRNALDGSKGIQIFNAVDSY